jgi:hypothetical protein
MSERLHTRDYIGRFGLLFLFIISYAVPAFHSFLEQENHFIEYSACYVLDEENDNHDILFHSNYEIECSHSNHVMNGTEKCEWCALILSLRITSISLFEEEDNLVYFVQKSGFIRDEECEFLCELTQESRGPPLVF